MTLWLARAGKYGQREDFALQNNVIVIGWEELPDLSNVKIREALAALLRSTYPDRKSRTLSNWEGQLWLFLHEMQKDDLVAMPLKQRSMIVIGRITGDYFYRADTTAGEYYHNRPVEWLQEFPRQDFDPDLLSMFGALGAISGMRRNNAEARVRAMLAGEKPARPKPPDEPGGGIPEPQDLERIAQDQISTFINQKFKGHGLARLTGAVLQTQGYQVKISPEGPDGGVDIIAGRGVLGFEPPKLVVQVKSGDAPVDVGVLRELQGVMNSFSADQGLIVAWGGYRGTVEREAARQYFKIRLWDADDLVGMLQDNYDRLPETIQAELPLKRIWTLVQEEE